MIHCRAKTGPFPRFPEMGNQALIFPESAIKPVLYKNFPSIITVAYSVFFDFTNWLRFCSRDHQMRRGAAEKEIPMKLAKVLLASSIAFGSSAVLANEAAPAEHKAEAAAEAPAAEAAPAEHKAEAEHGKDKAAGKKADKKKKAKEHK
jgi:hypothetical protein